MDGDGHHLGRVLYTFGDSVLDSAAYSGVTAGQILAKRLRIRLAHFARDGATSADLDRQWSAALASGLAEGIALISVGGNDFIEDPRSDWGALTSRLERLVAHLAKRRVKSFVANVYDPTLGDDDRDPLGVPPSQRPQYRAAYERLNSAIAAVTTAKRGAAVAPLLVDLHAHFLRGDESWFTRTIEPSERGAREVANAFLAQIDPPK